MTRKPKVHEQYLVTKHFGNGMMHHVGSPTSDSDEVARYVKGTNYRRNYKGHVWISTWKLVETKEVGDDSK